MPKPLPERTPERAPERTPVRLPALRRLVPGLVLLVAVLAGCASGAFQERFEAGDYAAAAEVFRADPSLHEDEDALFRMAVMQAAPESPVHDLAGAEESLRRLLRLHPDGDRRHEADLLLTLIRETVSLRTQLERLKEVDLRDVPPDSSGRLR